MALTRAQLLMGNDQQGAVLPGEVQAVKQGAGIFIDTDGTISVDSSSVTGLVKLNSLTAFNGYVWPNTKGGEGQMLTMGTGNNLVWTNGGVFVNNNPPLNPEIGDLWFDCGTGQLLVYEACTSGSPKWTSGSEGLPVLPGDTSATPPFASGDGTFANPYICTASSASVSGTIVVNRVTIIGLAPFQFVPIIDLNAVVNGGRFSASNNVANGSGVLIFDLLFNDSPTSGVGVTYTCALKVGYGSVYINAPVTMTDVFVLNSAGTISGIPQVDLPLTYTPGTAAGGAPPYTPSWVWKRFGDNATLQTGGNTYTPPAGEFGNSVYVTLTIQDSEGQVVTGSTSDYGPIAKPPFPNPTPPTFPTVIGQDSSFIWDGSPTTLESDDCLLFKVGAGPFNQGPTPVGTGNLVTTRWSTSPLCGGGDSGTLVSGCLFDTQYSACNEFVIDRIPDAISFPPIANVPPSGTATSVAVTVTGNNAPAYLTQAPGSTGSPGTFMANIGGSGFVSVPAAGVYSLLVPPGSTLALAFQVGSVALTPYDFNFFLGDSTGGVTGTFTATTGESSFPTTNITFPTTTSGANAIATSVAWGNGSTTLSATGCIEFSVDGGSNFGQGPFGIIDGVQLQTRWISSAPCADAPEGTLLNGSIGNGTNTESASLTVDRVPGSVIFNTQTSATTNTTYISNVVTPVGYNSTSYVTLQAGNTLTSVEADINGGGFSLIPAAGSTSMPIEPGQTLRVRGTTGGTASTDYDATILLGVTGNTSASTYTVEVGVAVPSITTPSIATPPNGTSNVGTSTGLTLTGSGYVANDGAGTHASSSWEVYRAGVEYPETSPIINVSQTPVYVQTFEKSVRFVPSSQPKLSFTPATSGDRKKWTLSCWVKKGVINSSQVLFSQGSVSTDLFQFSIDNGSGSLAVTDTVGGVQTLNLVTTSTFVDATNWYNIVLICDTTLGVEADRFQLWVNGVRVTSFATSVVYSQNSNTSVNANTPFNFGGGGIPYTSTFSGGLTGVNFADGVALSVGDFGYLSGTQWVPAEYIAGFGTGTNGFQLYFQTGFGLVINTLSLGKDTSGNDNNFTPTNIFAGNQTDYSVQWNSNPPINASYLVVGTAGNGGAGSSFGSSGAGGGGGGGGVAEVIAGFNPLAGTTYSYRQPSNGNAIFLSSTGGRGVDGVSAPFSGNVAGGASGAPQNNPGSAAAPGSGSGGGGGAGGAAPSFSRTPGPGYSSSVTGAAALYGAGGLGAVEGSPFGGPGNPGFGLPGTQNRGLIISWIAASGASDPISGPYLSGVFSTVSGTRSVLYSLANPSVPGGTILTFPQENLYFYSAWVADAPAPMAQANTGAGNEVTGNYAVLKASTAGANIAISNAGLGYVGSGNGAAFATASMITGKYYWEVRALPSQTLRGRVGIGTSSTPTFVSPGATSASYALELSTGDVYTNNVVTAYGEPLVAGGTLGVAFDADAGTLFFAINGVWQNGGNPVSGLNPAFSGLTSGPYFPVFGASTSSVTQLVNFGQMEFRYFAPDGYGPLIDTPTTAILTLSDSTNLGLFSAGDVVEERPQGADAYGVVASVDSGTNTVVVTPSIGVWNIGGTIANLSAPSPAGYPTTEPPNPQLYTLIASATNSVINKTSFRVNRPPLTPLDVFYARVRYKSNAIVVESNWSPFSKFTTGTLS